MYANRRRIRGERGKRLLRQRGEKLERSFAHLYETGGMRRVHLRRHPNILKRLLVHVAAFNLGLVMRKLLGRGTPRGLQGYEAAQYLTLLRLLGEVWAPSLTWTEDADSLELLEPPRSLPEPSNNACSPPQERPFPPRAPRPAVAPAKATASRRSKVNPRPLWNLAHLAMTEARQAGW